MSEPNFIDQYINLDSETGKKSKKKKKKRSKHKRSEAGDEEVKGEGIPGGTQAQDSMSYLAQIMAQAEREQSQKSDYTFEAASEGSQDQFNARSSLNQGQDQTHSTLSDYKPESTTSHLPMNYDTSDTQFTPNFAPSEQSTISAHTIQIDSDSMSSMGSFLSKKTHSSGKTQKVKSGLPVSRSKARRKVSISSSSSEDKEEVKKQLSVVNEEEEVRELSFSDTQSTMLSFGEKSIGLSTLGSEKDYEEDEPIYDGPTLLNPLPIRDYQSYLLESILDENQYGSIIRMNTGMGKTYVAILYIAHHFGIKYDENIPEKQHLHKKAIFVAPTLNLSEQQEKTLSHHLPLSVRRIRHMDSIKKSPKNFQLNTWEQNHIFVMVPDVLLQLLRFGVIKIEEIDLLIFDECHHCSKNDTYSLIMREFYFHCLPSKDKLAQLRDIYADLDLSIDEKYNKILKLNKRPHILGLTASPTKSKVQLHDEIMQSVQELCNNLYSTIISVQDGDQGKDAQINEESISIKQYDQSQYVARVSRMELFTDIEIFFNIREGLSHSERQQTENLFNRYLDDPDKSIHDTFKTLYEKRVIEMLLSLNPSVDQQHVYKIFIEFTQRKLKLDKYHRSDRIMVILMLSILQFYSLLMHQLGPSAMVYFINELINKSTVSKSEQKMYQFQQELRSIFNESIEELDDDEMYSDKFLTLKKMILKSLADKESKLIVFVQQRIVAQLLVQLLLADDEIIDALEVHNETIHSVTSHSSRGMVDKVLKPTNMDNFVFAQHLEKEFPNINFGKSSLQKQRQALDNFRTGKCRVIIGTSVIEEGLDVPQCNKVIIYDPIHTVKSFIQMKGRARQKGSKFIFMASDMNIKSIDQIKNNFLHLNVLIQNDQIFKQFKPQVEKTMTFFEDGNVSIYDNNDIYMVHSTGARMSIDGVLGQLNSLSQSLTSKYPNSHKFEFKEYEPDSDDEYTIPKNLTSGSRAFYHKIYFKLNGMDLEYHSKRGFTKKDDSKKFCGLKMVEMLHKKGFIDDHLLPASQAELITNMTLSSAQLQFGLQSDVSSEIDAKSIDISSDFAFSEGPSMTEDLLKVAQIIKNPAPTQHPPKPPSTINDEESVISSSSKSRTTTQKQDREAYRERKDLEQEFKNFRQEQKKTGGMNDLEIDNMILNKQLKFNKGKFQILLLEPVKGYYPFKTTMSQQIQIGFLNDDSLCTSISLFMKPKQLNRMQAYIANLKKNATHAVLTRETDFDESEQPSVMGNMGKNSGGRQVKFRVNAIKTTLTSEELHKIRFFHFYVFHLLYTADFKFYRKLLSGELRFGVIFDKMLIKLKQTCEDELKEVFKLKKLALFKQLNGQYQALKTKYKNKYMFDKKRQEEIEQANIYMFMIPFKPSGETATIDWDLIDLLIKYVQITLPSIILGDQRYKKHAGMAIENVESSRPLWISRAGDITRNKLSGMLLEAQTNRNRYMVDQVHTTYFNSRISANTTFSKKSDQAGSKSLAKPTPEESHPEVEPHKAQPYKKYIRNLIDFYRNKYLMSLNRADETFITCNKFASPKDNLRIIKVDKKMSRFKQSDPQKFSQFDLPLSMCEINPLGIDRFEFLSLGVSMYLKIKENIRILEFIDNYFGIDPKTGVAKIPINPSEGDFIKSKYGLNARAARKYFNVNQPVTTPPPAPKSKSQINTSSDSDSSISQPPSTIADLFKQDNNFQLVMEAFTCANSFRENNYEKLEFYGDSIIAVLSAYQWFLDQRTSSNALPSEEQLDLNRVKKLNNKIFFEINKREKYYQYMIPGKPEVLHQTFVPPGFEIDEFEQVMHKNRNELDNKTHFLRSLQVKNQGQIKYLDKLLGSQDENHNDISFDTEKEPIQPRRSRSTEVIGMANLNSQKYYEDIKEKHYRLKHQASIEISKCQDGMAKLEDQMKIKKQIALSFHHDQMGDAVESLTAAVYMVSGLHGAQQFLKHIDVISIDKDEQSMYQKFMQNFTQDSDLYELHHEQLAELQTSIGYQFKNKKLLIEALTHKSYFSDELVRKMVKNKKIQFSYETLEYFGDSIHKYFMVSTLYAKAKSEGIEDINTLNQIKSQGESNELLALICVDLNIHQSILHGQDQVTQAIENFGKIYQQEVSQQMADGKKRDDVKVELKSLSQCHSKIFADVIEALIAAIYLDSESMVKTKKVWDKWILPYTLKYQEQEDLHPMVLLKQYIHEKCSEVDGDGNVIREYLMPWQNIAVKTKHTVHKETQQIYYACTKVEYEGSKKKERKMLTRQFSVDVKQKKKEFQSMLYAHIQMLVTKFEKQLKQQGKQVVHATAKEFITFMKPFAGFDS